VLAAVESTASVATRLASSVFRAVVKLAASLRATGCSFLTPLPLEASATARAVCARRTPLPRDLAGLPLAAVAAEEEVEVVKSGDVALE